MARSVNKNLILMQFKRIYRALQWAIVSTVFVRLFPLWERMGFHITQNHFSQPIPDSRKFKNELWLRQSALVGVNMNEPKQIELINQFLRFKDEYGVLPKNKASKPWHYYIDNPTFGPVDAEILYCMLRHFKPKKMIEIGSGYSTYLSAQAILKNKEEGGYQTELIAIEPYPNEVLKSGFPGLSKLIPMRVQDVDLAEYNKLGGNDILFVDSSHVLSIGSDVFWEYLEILPRLSKGVIVHIHDIFFPYDYPKKWIIEMRRFWSEQYLLQAFLSFNNAFEVLWCGSYMHVRHPDKLEAAFSSYHREMVWDTPRPGASSLWMRKIE